MRPSAHILTRYAPLADALEIFLQAHEYNVYKYPSAEELFCAARPDTGAAIIIDVFAWTAPAAALRHWLGGAFAMQNIVGLSGRSARETARRCEDLVDLRVIRLPFDGSELLCEISAFSVSTPAVPLPVHGVSQAPCSPRNQIHLTAIAAATG